MAYGWTMVPKVYAVTMTITAIAFWFFTYTNPAHTADAAKVTVKEQLMALKDPTVWRYSQYLLARAEASAGCPRARRLVCRRISG